MLIQHAIKCLTSGKSFAMCWVVRKSSYVAKARLLQELKDSNKKCQQYLENGHFLLYNKGKPLVSYKRGRDTWNTSTYAMLECNYASILQYYLDSDMLSRNSVLLGLNNDGQATWAASLPSSQEDIAEKIEAHTNGIFLDMRAAIFILPTNESNIISKGNSLLYWHHHFKFCNRCGSTTQRNISGSLISCTSCGHHYFPQVSPVVITAVSSADYSKCLLVRQPRHIQGMYTAVAGYVEAGETFEDAVRREIAEEVGLEVLDLNYLYSQHWPLPTSSLMLGCIATVDDAQQVNIDKSELEDAKWFCHSVVKQAVEFVKKTPFPGFAELDKVQQIFIPPKGALAHDLIKYWLNKSAE